jgi:hypothetical protein
VTRRRNRTAPQLAISEHELSSMTADLDQLHNQTFPAVRTTLDGLSADVARLSRRPAARRTFLMGLGGAVALGTVAACSSSGSGTGSGQSRSAGGTPGPSVSGATYTGDLKVVALAAALENLAITAYQGALTMAGKGQLGTVPPAVATFVQTAMKQHQDHAAAWNGVLTKAGKPPINGAPLSITQKQVMMLQAAKSVPDVARLALNLENVAAETYTFATANVSDAGGIMTAASIQPVEAMHAAILSFVLGEYPVPVSFIGISKAVPPTALSA